LLLLLLLPLFLPLSLFVLAVILSEAKDPEALHRLNRLNLSTSRLKPSLVLLLSSAGICGCASTFPNAQKHIIATENGTSPQRREPLQIRLMI
jgi:hypothetical protein